MAIDWNKNVLQPVNNIFGEPTVYYPADGGQFDLTGVFDQAYAEVIITDDNPPINSVIPVLGVNVADFPGWYPQPKKNDRLYIASVDLNYIVRDVRPDGHGHIKLMLAKTGS